MVHGVGVRFGAPRPAPPGVRVAWNSIAWLCSMCREADRLPWYSGPPLHLGVPYLSWKVRKMWYWTASRRHARQRKVPQALMAPAIDPHPRFPDASSSCCVYACAPSLPTAMIFGCAAVDPPGVSHRKTGRKEALTSQLRCCLMKAEQAERW